MTSELLKTFLEKTQNNEALKMPNKKSQSKDLVKLKQQYKEKKSVHDQLKADINKIITPENYYIK